MYHLAKSLYLWATSKEEYSVLLLGLDNAGKTTLLNSLKALYSTSPSHPSSAAASISTLNPKPTVPTVGQNVSTLNLQDMYLKIWDVGGQDSLRGLWNSYYEVCHAIVFVVDGCDVGDEGDEDGIEEGGEGEGDGEEGEEDDIGDGDGNKKSNGENMKKGEGHGRLSKRPLGPKRLTTHQASLLQSPSPSSTSSSHNRLDEARRALLSVLSHPSTASIPLLVLANKQDREDCVETVRIKEGLVRRVFESEAGSGVRDSRVLPVSALRGDGVVEAVEWVRTRVRWNWRDGGRAPVMRS